MPRLGDTPDHYAIKREFSPDRRLAIDWLPYPDPRSDWEVRNPEAAELRDAATGDVIGHFGYWTMIEKVDWPAAGGANLVLQQDQRLTIAPDLATFTAGPAGSRPIGELPDWLASLIPPPPPPPPPPGLIERMAPALILIAALALIVFALSRVSGIRETFADLARGGEPERGTSGITGWMVRCEDIGFAPMSLQPDGRLRVPAAIAAEPLPPIGDSGRRFGDGRVVVELDGLDARWWPKGETGAAIRCRTTIRRD